MRDYRCVIFNDAILFAIQLSGRLKFKQLAHIGSVSTATNDESPKNSFIMTAGSKLYSFSTKSAKAVRQFVEHVVAARESLMETIEKSVDPSKFGTMSIRTMDSGRSGSGSCTPCLVSPPLCIVLSFVSSDASSELHEARKARREFKEFIRQRYAEFSKGPRV